MVRSNAIALLLLAACQGQGGSSPSTPPPTPTPTPTPTPPSGSATRPPVFVARDASSAAEEGSDEPSRVKPDEPDPVDAGKQIAELAAVPAWQAVVDRTRYLARRGQHGVVFGTVGPDILVVGPMPEPSDGGVRLDAGLVSSGYVWLVDDTEGNGALAIRIQTSSPLHEHDRVALGGSWTLDDHRKWYWKANSVTPLPPAPASDLKDPPAAPGHTVANGALPRGVRPISLAKDGDAVYFQLVGLPPAIDGDGWPVADELGNPVVALLNLPGERPSYGAQDMRTADERWQLKRGQTYWVRIGIVHKHGPDKPATINARTQPVRVM
jgi:hypothetical protein